MTRGEGRLFDGYVAVDWSASGTPKTGPDSIWISFRTPGDSEVLENPGTRAEAVDRIEALLARASAIGHRILCGFDFPFGYPAGTAQAITGEPGWAPLWRRIAALIEEGPRNSNNRFDVAAILNASFPGEGPFWGNGLKRDIAGLARTKRKDGWGESLPPNARHAETRVRSAQEVWKLTGVGSVGGQALTGIAALERIRHRCGAAIWPFETLGDGTAHVFAEIYPSLLEPAPGDMPKDARQVTAVTDRLARLDAQGDLARHLAAAGEMPVAVHTEEAMILGMADPEGFRSCPTPHVYEYERDPAAIYRQSFATIEAEADLSALSEAARPLAIRLIHACGMVDVAADIRLSSGAVEAGRAAVGRVAGTASDQTLPIFCDSEMVARGIIARALPAGVSPVVTLNDPSVPDLAKRLGTTRSAAATELWRARLEGSIVAIGNAPTALFHLLEGIERGWPRPALILGFPVGFVGAAESKQALAERPHGVPFVTLLGRRGGSAMAAAAVNALTLGLGGDGT
ncbi:precorrin-8X methylmutase [Tropicimonas aquimaris]|uniref:Precorrin-8X methylmutase n=1 Tax=Tropicimonas aquimaris TaxID=914152 RepID=A0ABW3IJR2_9RHOB